MENNNQNPNNGERTFTQDEVNSIVSGRLAEERKKYSDYDTMKKQLEGYDDIKKKADTADGLQKQLDQLKADNKVKEMRERIAGETGVPAHLLTGSDEESCKKQAQDIAAFAGKKSYPGTKKNGSKTASAGSSEGGDWNAFRNSIFGER